MNARLTLLLLIAAGPTPGLSIGTLKVNVDYHHQPEHAAHEAVVHNQVVEVGPSGSTQPFEEDLIRRGDASLKQNEPDDDVYEPASTVSDGVDAQGVTVDSVSLCGQSCKDVIGGGAPCESFYGSGCKGAPPPGFQVESLLYDLCPLACGPKPEKEKTMSWVWLQYGAVALLSALTFFVVIAAIMKLFFPKAFAIWAGRIRQVQKSMGARYDAWKYGAVFEYEEWEDEDWEEEYEEEGEGEGMGDEDVTMQSMNEDGASKSMMDDEGASQSMMDDEGASQSNIMDGASQSMMDDAGASQSMFVDEQATTMMGGTTMMPTMMGGATTNLNMATTVMGSSVMDEQATAMMDEQPTAMMGTAMMGSSVLPEADEATMQNFSSTDTL